MNNAAKQSKHWFYDDTNTAAVWFFSSGRVNKVKEPAASWSHIFESIAMTNIVNTFFSTHTVRPPRKFEDLYPILRKKN